MLFNLFKSVYTFICRSSIEFVQSSVGRGIYRVADEILQKLCGIEVLLLLVVRLEILNHIHAYCVYIQVKGNRKQETGITKFVVRVSGVM